MSRSGYLQTSYAGVVECCDGVVNPLILLGLIAGNKNSVHKILIMSIPNKVVIMLLFLFLLLLLLFLLLLLLL